MTTNDVSPRWVGSGWTVFNNKGKPVRQYEPFFTDTHRFEFDVKIGVSPVLFYDPVERVVATLRPNHTMTRLFSTRGSRQATTSTTPSRSNPKADEDIKEFFTRLQDADYLPTWYDQRLGGLLGAEEQDACGQGSYPCKHAFSYACRLARPNVPDHRAQQVRAQWHNAR